MTGRVVYTYPISTQAGQTDEYLQELPEDGRAVRMVFFFPKNTKTNLRLTPVVDDRSLNETSHETDDSKAIDGYLVGSGVTYEFDISADVYEGQDLGVKAENVHGSSDLDAFAAITVDHSQGGNQ